MECVPPRSMGALDVTLVARGGGCVGGGCGIGGVI